MEWRSVPPVVGSKEAEGGRGLEGAVLLKFPSNKRKPVAAGRWRSNLASVDERLRRDGDEEAEAELLQDRQLDAPQALRADQLVEERGTFDVEPALHQRQIGRRDVFVACRSEEQVLDVQRQSLDTLPIYADTTIQNCYKFLDFFSIFVTLMFSAYAKGDLPMDLTILIRLYELNLKIDIAVPCYV